MTRKEIAQLQRKAKRFHISHSAIAAEAGVTRPMVSHVFSYRAKSQKVLDAAIRLVTRLTDAQPVGHESWPGSEAVPAHTEP